MKRILTLVTLLSLGNASAQTFGFTLSGGYRGGAGLDVNLFARELGRSPYGVRLSSNANFNDPYQGSGEREIGLNIAAGLDLLYTLPAETPGLWFDLYAGPRANFFIGTDSDSSGFVTTESLLFGAGVGAATTYRLARYLNVVLDTGLEGYLPSALNVNTLQGSAVFRPGDSGYRQVDDIINQPKLLLKLKLGLQLSF
ncbi:hypothetical protein [Deinococcus peraridilitoris]|uniref:Outer membrane protein beta-barrel domain-containing protein n=1 Tax=Deinococcus peraridilitoris (strain DSM 19664 / LMG 22246 / CIP 109416 / KR-200) TaxID=937777 RepID=K9ZYL6_DEIPD|nr:hypothetical protein [Deinococcus peraridilitoris]AFZ66743.1 hypothetical protein Deipe_1187 [Deinococcus peraridilitoris DSM 19664]